MKNTNTHKEFALLITNNGEAFRHKKNFRAPIISLLQIEQIEHAGKQVKKFEALTFDFYHKNSMRSQFLLDNYSDLMSSNWSSNADSIEIIGARTRKNQELTQFIYHRISDRLRLAICNLKYPNNAAWYQRTPSSENRFLTAKINLIKDYKQIKFTVKQKQGKFSLEPQIILLNDEILSESIHFFYCFIQSDNDFCLLKPQDLNVLHHLYSMDAKSYYSNPNQFLEHIVAPIEKTHKVDRGDYFNGEVWQVIPKNIIQLSELSGSFLIINIKFDYGIAIFDTEYQESCDKIIDGKLYQIKRNKHAEESFRNYVQSLHPKFQNQLFQSFNLSFKEAQANHWFYNNYHEWLEKNVEIIGIDMLSHFRFSEHSFDAQMEILSEERNNVIMRFDLNFGEERIRLKDVRRTLLAGEKMIYLKDGSLGVLPEKWVEEFEFAIKHGKINEDQINVPKWIFLNTKSNSESRKREIYLPSDWWERWDKWKNTDEKIYDFQSLYNVTLRPYQRKGVEWMLLLSEINAGACLADDMGLGKTLQTIAFFSHLLQRDKEVKFLVVCPASLIYNWKKELETFTPTIKTMIYHGNQRSFSGFLSNNASVMICSYSTARNDAEILAQLFWDAMVLDESHNIRNINSLTTKAILKITAQNNILLSGTPMVNNTFDLFAQFQKILPDLLGSQEFFNSVYAQRIDKNKDEIALQNLRKITNPFILRRTKHQVAKELPQKIENILYCEMGDDQRAVYENTKTLIKQELFSSIHIKGIENNKLNILQGMMKLRQICCNPAMLNDRSYIHASSVKLEVLLEEIEENLGNHKILVFSQFLGMLDAISIQLRKRMINHFRFDGSTPSNERMEMVEAFQKDESKERVFLISLKAGNSGITLTEADYVFLVDPWWNEAIERQAIDRTHRIGQKNTVFAYKMICKNTIEEKMIQLQKQKQLIADELIVADESIIKNLTEVDLAFLFE